MSFPLCYLRIVGEPPLLHLSLHPPPDPTTEPHPFGVSVEGGKGGKGKGWDETRTRASFSYSLRFLSGPCLIPTSLLPSCWPFTSGSRPSLRSEGGDEVRNKETNRGKGWSLPHLPCPSAPRLLTVTSCPTERSGSRERHETNLSPLVTIPLPHLVGCRHEVTAVPANRREVSGTGRAEVNDVTVKRE